MKTITLTFLCFLFIIKVNSQATTTLQQDNLPEVPWDMAFYNNELYFVLQNTGKIAKINPSTVNAPLVDVLTGLNFPRSLKFVGSELFYIEAANSNVDPNTGKLSKIDATQTNPTPSVIATTLNLPLQMEGNANATKFYISEVTTNPDGTFEHTDLSVIDISGGAPVKTILYNQYFNIEDLVLKGNTLYIFAQEKQGAEGGPWQIYTLDVTTNTPGTPTLYYSGSNAHSGTILGDFIYFTDFGKNIRRINTTDSSPSATLVTDEIKYMSTDFAGNVFSYGCLTDGGNTLYTFGETTNTLTFVVFKTDLSTLRVDEFQNENAITLFPNPSNESISFTNLKNTYGYKIYAVTGQQVKHGQISVSKTISINELTKGLYFLKFNDGELFKFIKN